MSAWDKLSMSEKADVMKLAIEGGVYDLYSIREGYNKFAEGGKIHIAPSKRGTFTAAAKKHGKSVQAFASQVLAHPENYSPAMVKKANFARNAKKWKHGLGGNLFDGTSQPNQQMFVREKNNNPIAFDTEGNLTDQVTGDKGTINLPEITIAPSRYSSAFEGNSDLAPELLRFTPVLGDALDAADIVNDTYNGNYINAALGAGLLTLPNFIEKPTKAISKGVRKFIFKTPTESSVSKETIEKALDKAKSYKESEDYRKLVESFIEETGSKDIPIGTFYDSRHSKIPNIVLEKRPDGHFGGYTYSTNKISIDPSQAPVSTPFHEGLHWQRIGKPELYKGEDFESFIKAINENAPKDVKEDLFNKYYYSEIGQKTLQQEDVIKKLYDEKVHKVVDPDTPKNNEMWKPSELAAHAFGVGESLGLEPFQKYPGIEKALKTIKKARKKDSYLYDIKARNGEEIENFWKLLTGNYIPATLIGTSAFGLQNLEDK